MGRELWVGIIIGLIIGWIIEWFIDWLYWRRKYRELMKDCGDDLILINGVGPVIEERLHKAGIFTFKQLAEAKTEALRAAIGQAQNLADEQDLIKQAKKFVQEKAARKSRPGA
jgi:hypothetical protein